MAYDINLASWLSAVQWIKYQFSVVKYRIILIIYPAHLGMVRHLLRNGVLYRRLAGGFLYAFHKESAVYNHPAPTGF